jgi:hypothetical protein
MNDRDPNQFISSNVLTDTRPAFEASFTDQQTMTGLYLCVLVKGQLPSGERGYCYFGIFADTLIKFIERHSDDAAFNPKQIKGIVLARSTGEPSPEIREFMRMKFSFSDETTILELSRLE